MTHLNLFKNLSERMVIGRTLDLYLLSMMGYGGGCAIKNGSGAIERNESNVEVFQKMVGGMWYGICTAFVTPWLLPSYGYNYIKNLT